jgi:hypothetical protein
LKHALANLSKEGIDAVTGGDTYCWIRAWIVEDEEVIFVIHTVGKSPLHEVMVYRLDQSAEEEAIKSGTPLSVEDLIGDAKFTYSYPAIPFLSSTSTHMLDAIKLGSKKDKYSFHFRFFSMNGG